MIGKAQELLGLFLRVSAVMVLLFQICVISVYQR
jgi:hypothetical protein